MNAFAIGTNSVNNSVLGSWYGDLLAGALANDNGAALPLKTTCQGAQGVGTRPL